MPSGLSLHRRRRLHLKRVLHVIVMALNYWHGGLGNFPNESLLKRCPSKVHRTIYHKITGILVADGPGTERFEVLKCGRRFPQLDARLGELSDCLTKLGVAGPYGFMYQGHTVPLDNEKLPELTPYRSLNAEQLKLTGDGSFNATNFLSDSLCLPYRYPDVLLHDGMPVPGEYPMHTDPPEEIIKLARVCDSRGLLYIFDGEVPPWQWTRFLNNFKNLEEDRQIGDRRGRNYCECRLSGPRAFFLLVVIWSTCASTLVHIASESFALIEKIFIINFGQPLLVLDQTLSDL